MGGLLVGGSAALSKVPNSRQIGDAVDTPIANADVLQGTVTDSNAVKQTGDGSQSRNADEMYESIRASETDAKSISENTGFKETNIEKIKDHVFNEEHLLDRYVDQKVPAETKRFDSNVDQAKAWNRLEWGTHTPDDITWMKHETAESWYEKKNNSGYSEAHDRVEGRWCGNPLGND